MYADKIKNKVNLLTEGTVISTDDFLSTIDDPTPFLTQLTNPNIEFNSTNLFSCCDNQKIVNSFNKFIPWNKQSSNPIILPLDEAERVTMSVTVLHDGAKKMEHYHLQYDPETRKFVGKEFQFHNTMSYGNLVFDTKKVLEVHGQEHGFSVFYRKATTGQHPSTLVTTRKASESAVLQAIDGNSSVADTERHNTVQALLKVWVDAGIIIEQYKVHPFETDFEFLGNKVFTPYRPEIVSQPQIEQQLSQSISQITLHEEEQMIDNSEQPQTQNSEMDISQTTQTNQNQISTQTDMSVTSQNNNSTLDQHFYNISCTPTDIRLRLPVQTQNWADDLEKLVEKDISLRKLDVNANTITACATETILRNTTWGNHAHKCLEVFGTVGITPVTSFKRKFCPGLNKLVKKDAEGNRKRADEVTEVRRVAKNALQQLKYSTIREHKSRQALLLFSGFCSHLHHHLTQITTTVLQNKHEFPEQIYEHCSFLQDKMGFVKDSSLQFTFDKAYHDLKAEFPKVRSNQLYDGIPEDEVE